MCWTVSSHRFASAATALLFAAGAAVLPMSPAALAAKPVGQHHRFQSGQVFASVGAGAVNIYDPTTASLVTSLNDRTNSYWTTGTAFDSLGNLYVTDYTTSDVSRFSKSGKLQPMFASGSSTFGFSAPESLVFDSAGNLYVGLGESPVIYEFNASGALVTSIGIFTEGYVAGANWIDLAADGCTLFYTSQGTDVLRFNNCTPRQQLTNFNQAPLPLAAQGLKIRPGGDVLVADSGQVVRLGPSGNLLQTYPCSFMLDCKGSLSDVALDPDGTSFWTSDSYSGDIWRVDIASGSVMQRIRTGSISLEGVSVYK
jgi:hypothetical protein